MSSAAAPAFALPSAADDGFRNASSYDTYRPSYPEEAVEKLLQYLGIAGKKHARILEIAAGTGKFTELLARRPEQFEIVAVEPHLEMRQGLVDKNLSGSLKVVEGSADKIPVEDGWADAVIAAQAFHWFATLDSLKEFHRVLQPEGQFGAIWNVEDYNAPKSQPTSKWLKGMNDILWSFEDNHPRFRHEKWRDVFNEQHVLTSGGPYFGQPIGEDKVEWTVWLTEEAVWNRFNTLSQIAIREGEEKEKVRKEVFDLFKGDDVQRNEKGELGLHGFTWLAWTPKITGS